jgi:hypothetical protein
MLRDDTVAHKQEPLNRDEAIQGLSLYTRLGIRRYEHTNAVINATATGVEAVSGNQPLPEIQKAKCVQ